MNSLKKMIKKIIKPLLQRGVYFINYHPRLRTHIISVANKLGLSKITRSLYRRFTRAHDPKKTIGIVQELTPNANQIYIELKNAIKKNKKESC